MEGRDVASQITVRRVDPEVWLRFRAEAVKQGKPVGELLSDVLRQWLEKQPK